MGTRAPASFTHPDGYCACPLPSCMPRKASYHESSLHRHSPTDSLRQPPNVFQDRKEFSRAKKAGALLDPGTASSAQSPLPFSLLPCPLA